MADQVPPLVTTSWLSQHLGTKKKPLIVLDVTWNPRGKSGNDFHQEQHIPGSLYFNLEECKDHESPFKFTLPSPNDFDKYVSNLGISNQTHVVIYENDPRYKAKTSERVWWMFRYFGHDKVSVLDGGLEQWVKDGFSVTSDSTEDPVKATFKSTVQRHLLKTYDEVLEDLKEGSVQLVDTRPSHWFDGSKPSLWPDLRLGTIHRAKHLTFEDCMAKDSTRFRTAAELREVFASADIDLSKPVTTTCNVGVTACIVAMAAFLQGKEDVAVFDGSWDEFSQRAPDDLLRINIYHKQ
ncbi:thiosulfate sulfurtransferase-like [Lytechinus variegatus]|uniref:thiosulfate sulfurtransferase-like n=1 Tax=Lytechinus variegatus TaxID=7654 RepID=UPI001BB1B02E|nr:thiosulfate sulfurtransferase-like [Lytechinus variegatus]XP_041473049.1 thiosulfate sulfurtransferase-like [Lytechinus variegatus]